MLEPVGGNFSMISKSSLVYFTNSGPDRLFVVITEPYEWGQWQGKETQVVDIYDESGIRTANVLHLTEISK